MAVTIDSGPVVATNRLRHVPENKWRELMLARRRFCEINISYDYRCLVQFVNDTQEMFAALGFASPEAMVREGYGLEPAEIALAVEWLKLNPTTEPISLNAVLELGKHGGDRRSEKVKDQGDNITLKERGTSRAYIIARLERDGHHELAAKVREKKLSANAAAEEAGFRKKRARRKRTALELILAQLPKLTTGERLTLRESLDAADAEDEAA